MMNIYDTITILHYDYILKIIININYKIDFILHTISFIATNYFNTILKPSWFWI